MNTDMPNAPKTHPTWAFALQSSAHLIALGFGSGLMRPAPGTWGTVFGWITYHYCVARFGFEAQGLVIAAAFLVGVWACGVAGKNFGVIDHGAWVWDEVVAIWLVLWLLPAPASFLAQLIAFGLFRLFDIVKPPPIRQWDARLKSGFGVMWDDIVAAFYTLLVIALWIRLVG
jgi:phosphatidylglycerophosphatase A